MLTVSHSIEKKNPETLLANDWICNDESETLTDFSSTEMPLKSQPLHSAMEDHQRPYDDMN